MLWPLENINTYVIRMGHFDHPGKFGAVFASIPAPIFAALYCIFFAYAGE